MTVNKLPKTGTITRRLLEFVSRHKGVRFTQMQQFICEISGLDWDQREVVSQWVRDPNAPTGWGSKKRTVRRFRGWWCTNLCHGPDSVCRKYLTKKDGVWFLNEETANLFRELANRTGQSNVIYSAESISPALASNNFVDPLPVAGPVPASTLISLYTDPAKLTGAQSFDPTTGVRLEFVPKVEVPLGPTIPEGSFKIHQPQPTSDVELVRVLREAQANVVVCQNAMSAAAAALRDAQEALANAEAAVRKAFEL